MATDKTTLTNKSRTKSAINFPSSSNSRRKNFHQAAGKVLDPNGEGFSSLESKAPRGSKCMVRLKIESMGPVCKARRKTNDQSSRIFDDEESEERNDQGWPANHQDEESSMWLFSGSSSPASCCFDDKIFKNLLDFSLDDWLVSVLVLRDHDYSSSSPDLSKENPWFDDDEVVLKEDHDHDHDFLEKETASWLMKSLRIDDDDSLYSSKRNFRLFENTEIQEMLMLDSLIDLDVNSEWISDPDLSFLQIDFPSPCYRNIWGYNCISQLSDLIPANNIGHIAGEGAQIRDHENLGSDHDHDHEPIFWPLVQKFDWSSEFSRDFLIMSPRQNMCGDEKLMANLPENLQIWLQNTGIYFKEKHKPRINHSRMVSAKILEPQSPDDIVTDGKILVEDIDVLDKLELIFLEEDFLGVEELPIEQLIGLNEFDGLEGINF